MLAHSYRLATYSDSSGRPRAGLVVDDRVIDVSTSLKATPAKFLANSMTSVMAVLKRWRVSQRTRFPRIDERFRLQISCRTTQMLTRATSVPRTSGHPCPCLRRFFHEQARLKPRKHSSR